MRVILLERHIFFSWYVSKLFEVVRMFDTPAMDDGNDVSERPRHLVAVDFRHDQDPDPDLELGQEQSGRF